MKIIAVDSYARENVADILVCENVNEYYAKLIVQLLNYDKENSRWFVAVEDDHKLWRGMEEFV